ncbi:MAG: OmpA family protein [Burkholderiaceae bacterium]|nr:OmpA family protein [Burkholderiaceae bacterium]
MNDSAIRSILPLLPWLLMLGSCTSPPKPPTPDESNRRPVNSAQAIELQSCRSELQNTRILASEASRAAEAAAFTAARLHERQQVLAALVSTASPAPANAVFTVHFSYGSARANLPQDIAEPLLTSARSAPLVVLRGRTDGVTDAPGESHIARLRAAAVRDALVAGGVDPQRIRETFQPSGDHVADNHTPEGRGLNRRVEIEVYRATPAAASAATLAAQ